MKKNLTPFIALFLLTFSVLAFCADPITMDIETYDFVPGELVLGGRDLFQLIVQNNTDATIKLAIGGNYFYYDSPFWKVTVNGPLDPKCVLPPSVERMGLAHNPTELKVQPGTNKFRCPAGAKVGQPGSYSISIEYDGITVPQGCYRGRLRTPERSYTVKPLLGADAELYALWKKQNPEKSICFFPVGMQPDVMKPSVLIKTFPASTLAGWALCQSDPGARLEIESGKILVAESLLPAQDRSVYKGSTLPDEKGKMVFISPEEFAEQYVKSAEQFLSAHPDHVNVGLIYAQLSLAYMVLHRWQDAYQAAEKSLELPWQEWRYSFYPPRLGIEKAILREAKEDMVRRSLAKIKAK